MDAQAKARDLGVPILTHRADYRVPCPKCSPDRRKKRDPCLHVTIDRRQVLFHCHHCEFNGATFDDDEFRESPRRVTQRPHEQAQRRRPGW